MTTVAERLHQLRTERGMSQRELAEPRYTAAFVSSVEAGKRTASVEALEYFAGRLGVGVDELRTGRAADRGLRLELALAEAEAAGVSADFLALLETEGLSEAQRAWCHIGLGHAALAVADLADATAHFEAANRHFADSPPHHRTHATVGRAATLHHQGDARYAVYLLTEARDELTRTGHPDPSALLALHVHLAVAHSDLGDDIQAADAAESALALAAGPRATAVAYGHLATARTLLAAGPRRATAEGHLSRRSTVPRAGASAEAASASGGPVPDANANANANASAEAAIALAQRPRSPGGPVPDATALTAAAVAIAQAREALREAALHSKLAWCHRARGLRRARSADREGALADLATAERLFAESGQHERHVDTALELAELRLAMGIAEPELPIAHTPVQQARADRLRALMSVDLAAKERHLTAAIAGFRDRGPRPELARAVNELADLLEAVARSADALHVLRTGLADVQRLNSQT